MVDKGKSPSQDIGYVDLGTSVRSVYDATLTPQTEHGLAYQNLRYSRRPIPSALTAKTSSMISKTIYLCEETSEELLFVVDVHTGYSGTGPLGLRPGIILYDGTSKKKDALLAAAGYMNRWHVLALSVDSRIFLPPVMPEKTSTSLTKETMRAHTCADGGPAFTFSIVLERSGRLSRETFQWRKCEDLKGRELGKGGFKLLWIAAESEAGLGSNGGGGADLQPHGHASGQVVASFSRLTTLTAAISLRFEGDGLSGVLGDRWRIAVVITALRLRILQMNGGTNKLLIEIGNKIYGKQRHLPINGL
ncbi:hypothetical protein JX265_003204 [Neoarthrinium moseri]|uniref:Uncharacterized protein n=1 Tax=Neoarthrinium moseri TaxID=1658444 RepID=A0A9Q0ATV8_9PEZI|nr:hypothetical protein JX265_003204 [Neoarthrinium moseri]